MREVFENDPEWDEEEEEQPTECERCAGSGEIGPFGWEYPEYETCPDCHGTGVEDNYCAADTLYEQAHDK